MYFDYTSRKHEKSRNFLMLSGSMVHFSSSAIYLFKKYTMQLYYRNSFISQETFTCSKSIIETLEKGFEHGQS